eukprot:3718324-Rhodomonas_salina.1
MTACRSRALSRCAQHTRGARTPRRSASSTSAPSSSSSSPASATSASTSTPPTPKNYPSSSPFPLFAFSSRLVGAGSEEGGGRE